MVRPLTIPKWLRPSINCSPKNVSSESNIHKLHPWKLAAGTYRDFSLLKMDKRWNNPGGDDCILGILAEIRLLSLKAPTSWCHCIRTVHEHASEIWKKGDDCILGVVPSLFLINSLGVVLLVISPIPLRRVRTLGPPRAYENRLVYLNKAGDFQNPCEFGGGGGKSMSHNLMRFHVCWLIHRNPCNPVYIIG